MILWEHAGKTANPVLDGERFPTEIDIWTNLWRCDCLENVTIQKPKEANKLPRMVNSAKSFSANNWKMNLEITWSLLMILEGYFK